MQPSAGVSPAAAVAPRGTGSCQPARESEARIWHVGEVVSQLLDEWGLARQAASRRNGPAAAARGPCDHAARGPCDMPAGGPAEHGKGRVAGAAAAAL
jgi:hypothetical protein